MSADKADNPPPPKRVRVEEDTISNSEAAVDDGLKLNAGNSAASPAPPLDTPKEASKEDATPALRIVDWDSALEQCGDDEDFLKELLNDLYSEAKESIRASVEVFEGPKENWPRQIEMAAHAIKGASANLMCEEMNSCALNLEKRAKKANEGTVEDLKEVKLYVSKLKDAVNRFGEYVTELQPSDK